MHVGPELVALRHPPHRRHDPVADDDGPDVATLALLDEGLDEHLLVRAVQGLDDRFGDLARGRQDDADALRALEQLDDDGCAAHHLDRGHDVSPVADEGRGRHTDVVAREDLGGAQLVAAVHDAVGGVGRVDVHLLELPHDGSAEVGDGGADARQDRVVGRELLAAEEQVRLLGRQVDGEAQGVEDSHLVATVECGGAQTLRRVGARGTREDREFHEGCLPRWSGVRARPSNQRGCPPW